MTDRLTFSTVEGGQSSMRLSSKPSNSSVQFTRLHNASQLVVIPRRVSGGEPAERSGDDLELEDNGGPCGEKDECGEPDHPNGHAKNEEDLGSKESDTPDEHGLREAEKECQILETIYFVPAFADVRVLRREWV